MVVALLSSCATSIDREEAAVLYLNLGNQAAGLGNYAKALQYFDQALLYDRHSVEGRYNKALVSVYLDDFASAQPILEQLIEDNPENTRYSDSLAWMYSLAGEYEEALLLYGEILEKNPDLVSVRMNAIRTALELSLSAVAEGHIGQLFEAGHTEPDLLYLKGAVLELENDPAAPQWYLAALLEDDTHEESRDALTAYGKSHAGWAPDLEILKEEGNANLLYGAALLFLSAGNGEEGFALIDLAVDRGLRIDSVTEEDLIPLSNEFINEVLIRIGGASQQD